MQNPNHNFYLKFILILSIFSIKQNVISQSHSWQLSGPPGGSIKYIVSLPDNHQSIIAANSSYFTGLLKTSDQGKSWQLFNQGLDIFPPGNSTTVYALSVNRTLPDIIFISLREKQFNFGLYRSLNCGENWQKMIQDTIITAINSYENMVYATPIGGGILRSFDTGETWQKIFPTLPEATQIVIDDSLADLYIGTYDDGLYFSPDSGTSFTQIGFNDSTIDAFDLINTDTSRLILLSTSTLDWGGVFLSFDNGQHWIARNNGLPPDLSYDEVTAVKIAPDDPNIFYLGTLLDGVYKSIDQGLNWYPVNNGLLIRSIIFPDNPASVLTLSFEPGNSNIIYAGTGHEGVFKTNDGGQNWSLFGVPATSVENLSVAAQNPKLVFAGTSMGSYRKKIDWEPTTLWEVNHHSIAVSPIDSNLVIASTENNIFMPLIYKSVDGGQTWNLNLMIPGESEILKIKFDPISPNRIYGAWTQGLIISDDEGDNWDLHYLGLGRDIAISPINNDELYLLEISGKVQKSTDRGISWITVRAETDTAYHSIEINPFDPSHIYISAYGIWESKDYGSTWSRLNLNTWVLDLEFDQTNGYLYAATYGDGVLYTTDRGVTWETLDVTPNPYFKCIDIGEDNGYSYIYAGTFWSGVFEWQIPVTSIQPHSKDSETIQTYNLFQNYPNPFNDETQIRFYLPEATNVKIEIFNILGQSVKTLIPNKKMHAGYHTVKWDGSDFHYNQVVTGIYLSKLSTNKYISTKKLLLLQ